MASRLYDVSFSWRQIAIGVCAAVAALLLLDRVCSWFVGPDYEFRSLVQPPAETVRYELRDFRFTAAANRLGFRGPEFPVHRTPGVARILVIGNSFAYGWGVEFEDTWPHLLERELAAAGVPVEVANLSLFGTNALETENIARRAIPLLKPDLIILAALQGGAYTTLQLVDAAPAAPKDRSVTTRGVLLDALGYAVPNYVRAVRVVRQRTAGAKFIPPSTFQREQKKAAATVIGQLAPEVRRRFDALDPGTSDRFVTGTLNAGIVMMALSTPNFWVDTVTSDKMIKDGTAGMRSVFAAVRDVAEPAGARVAVAAMPYGAYLGGAAAVILRRLGFNIPDSLERDRSTEDHIHQAADDAGVPFLSVLDGFRAQLNDDLFIPFDGHYSPAGTRLYAKLLSKEVLRLSPPFDRGNVAAQN